LSIFPEEITALRNKIDDLEAKQYEESQQQQPSFNNQELEDVKEDAILNGTVSISDGSSTFL